jgi:TonB-dependent starch-binding outer membrane protein SusC
MRLQRLLRVIVTLCAIVLLSPAIFAQNLKTITGTVTGQNNSPLAGATVTAKGSKAVTTTDAGGLFSFSVPSSTSTLVISYVGANSKEVALDGKSVVSVQLEIIDAKLSEVVVIGYGSAKRANISSAISSVTEKDLKNLPMAGADQAIQGKVAGVTVTSNGGQPGGGVSVRVRGVTSINNNEPLYVIDGVPVNASTGSLQQNVLGGLSGQTEQSVLATINPSDIASIDILKDASAQAIYGSRAANGVVIINTKRGKSGEGKINYDMYVGFQTIPKKLPAMDLREYAQYLNSIVMDARQVPGNTIDSIPEFRKPELLGEGTDWQDEAYQTGMIQNHQVAFSGGSGKTNYYFSGNYFNQEGILTGSNFKRYAARFNIDQQVKTWFRAGMSGNISRSNQKITLADEFDGITNVVLYNSPASPVRDFDGKFIAPNNLGGINFANPYNPIAMASYRDVRAIRSKIFGAIYGDIDILKGLTVRNEFNYDLNFEENKAFQPLIMDGTTRVIGPSTLREQRTNSYYWAFKTYVNYNNTFGVHTVSATGGHEVQRSHYDYITARRDGLTLNLPSLNAASAEYLADAIQGNAGDWAIESYFARLNYTYNNRYSVNLTFRADGSSNFSAGKKWGYFPGASASWTVTNESFAQNIKSLNYLKIRVGAGAVGNQNVGSNLYSANINLFGTAPFGPGGLPRNIPNTNYTWESVITYNAGIDATLFNRKIDVTIDAFRKVTTDMLMAIRLGTFSGIGPNWDDINTPLANDGKMTNTGIEFSITSSNIQSKNLTWKTTLNFSHYKNVLNYLNSPDAVLTGSVQEYNQSPIISRSSQGHPVGTFYGFVTDGLFRTMNELNNGTNWGLGVEPGKYWLGDVRYKDLNGDKKIDENDVAVIGNPNPKFTYGLNNTVTFKDFDLNVFIYGSYGADIYNYTRRYTEAMNNIGFNQLSTVLDHYSSTNTDGKLPRFNMWHNNNLRVSDRFVEDGSFLRIQTVALGYNIPQRYIRKVKLNSARVYVSAQNLYTFTNYSGYDPELGAYNNRATFLNVDNGRYPNPRTITFGANIEF